MAGQGMERREVLRFLGIASVAGAFPGFNKWAFACDHVDQERKVGVLRARVGYQVMFFSAEQYVMVASLAEMIIPGAHDAGVDEFIDFMVANRVPVSTRRDVKTTQDAIEMGIEAQNKWSAGLAWMNARSKSLFGHEFMKASAEQRTVLLEELAYKAKFKPGTESGREFFAFVRDYAVVGFYTTKIGLESIEYPGLRVVWPAMPACPHGEDRDHRHLAKAG